MPSTEGRKNLAWPGDNEIAWPAKPFYIQSKINLSNWALTVADDLVKLKPLQPNVEFLWTAKKDNRVGAVLKHVDTGLVLTSPEIKEPIWGMHEYGALRVAPEDNSNPLQLWRAENLGEPWVGINAGKAWQAKVNVYKSDPQGTVGIYKWDDGAPNEEWLLVKEEGDVTLESIDYDLNNYKKNFDIPPKLGTVVRGDNRQGDTSMKFDQSLKVISTRTVSFSSSTSVTRSTRYTQTFGVKGAIEKVLEITASGSLEQSQSKTINYGEQETKMDSQELSYTVHDEIPANKWYEFRLVVHSGQCTVPYKAHLKFQSSVPGAQPFRFDSEGVFTGVNLTMCEVVVSDLTQGEVDPTEVRRKEIPVPELKLTAVP